ncbi:hypothetical protein AB0M43_37830 [Longispora sp. NPDC051575]|uniref:hypothetical protein n=1 Tax=Longispora sp. NPDC051575 TaxID=3154943 RepID=UPI00342FA542
MSAPTTTSTATQVNSDAWLANRTGDRLPLLEAHLRDFAQELGRALPVELVEPFATARAGRTWRTQPRSVVSTGDETNSAFTTAFTVHRLTDPQAGPIAIVARDTYGTGVLDQVAIYEDRADALAWADTRYTARLAD